MAIFSKFRSKLYATAKFLGDAEAILSGNPKKIARRATRRTAGKIASRGIGKLISKLF